MTAKVPCEVRLLVKTPSVARSIDVKKFVEELLVAIKLETNAFVVVEFTTIRSVIRASVAIRLEVKVLVEVELPDMRLLKLPLLAEKFEV